MTIPFVSCSPSTEKVLIYKGPRKQSPLFEMDTEETRELVTMLVGSIVMIEKDPKRIELLFNELLLRAKKVCGS
jgi:hypothetical protein